jgi:ribosomal protein S18 acetylase RimI-like enzyme
MMRIRRAGPGDLDVIDAIEDSSFDLDRFARRNLARLLARPTAQALIADTASGPAGYALILFRKGAGVARLYSLAIAPAFRGRGFAKALLDAAAAIVVDKGCRSLRLEVRISNAAARRTYQNAGFAIVDEKHDYYADGENALVMEKRLNMRDVGGR